MKLLFRAVLALVLSFVVISAAPHSQASQIGKEMNEADAELNAVYKKVLNALPNDEAKTHLREAQRAWVAFVEAETSLHISLYTDSKGGIFIRLELTQARINQLKSIGARASANGYETVREQ